MFTPCTGESCTGDGRTKPLRMVSMLDVSCPTLTRATASGCSFRILLARSRSRATCRNTPRAWRDGRSAQLHCGAGMEPASHGLVTRVRASARKGGRQTASPERLVVARRPRGPMAGCQRYGGAGQEGRPERPPLVHLPSYRDTGHWRHDAGRADSARYMHSTPARACAVRRGGRGVVTRAEREVVRSTR